MPNAKQTIISSSKVTLRSEEFFIRHSAVLDLGSKLLII